MTTSHWPRIATGKPGSIANKIYSKAAIKHSNDHSHKRRRKSTSSTTFTESTPKSKKHSRRRRRKSYPWDSSDRSNFDQETISTAIVSSRDNYEEYSMNSRDTHFNKDMQLNLNDYLNDRGKFHSINSPSSDESRHISNKETQNRRTEWVTGFLFEDSSKSF